MEFLNWFKNKDEAGELKKIAEDAAIKLKQKGESPSFSALDEKKKEYIETRFPISNTNDDTLKSDYADESIIRGGDQFETARNLFIEGDKTDKATSKELVDMHADMEKKYEVIKEIYKLHELGDILRKTIPVYVRFNLDKSYKNPEKAKEYALDEVDQIEGEIDGLLKKEEVLSYEDLKRGYEDIRQKYESLRNTWYNKNPEKN